MPGPVQAIAEWLSLSIEEPRKTGASQLIAEEVARGFHELRAPLLRYTMSLGLPAEDGEDVVQEVFLQLFRHLLQRKSRQNLRAWIFRVTHNLALKRRLTIQRNSREPVVASVEWMLQDPGLTPEEQAARARQQVSLWAAVQALPERDRCCLNLRAEGLQYREIAATLGISLGTVASSLSRSLLKLSRVAER